MDRYNKTTWIKFRERPKGRKKAQFFEVGDSKQPVFYPQFKTAHWDNEANFSIRLKEDIEGSKVFYGPEVVEWHKGSKIARFYEKQVGPIGAFEFEVEYLNHPGVYEETFSIRGKNIVILPQGELTEDEKAKGFKRPDNIINSYAIYHSHKKHNEYKTGKLGHITRLYVEDATGKKEWCSSRLEGDDLVVELPKDFMDNASYPVILDPTFGYNIIGGSTAGIFSGNSYLGTEFTTTTGGNTTNLFVHAQCPFTGTGDPLKGIIYDKVSSAPTNVLAISSGAGSVNTAFDWYSVGISYTLASSTPYYLTAWVNGATNYSYDSGSTNQCFEKYNQTYPTPQDPLVTSTDFNWFASVISIYVDYDLAYSVDQEGFRFRNDDGSETTATWKAAQDTDTNQALNTSIRLRFLLNASGDPATAAYTLYYKLSTDSTYIPVPLVATVPEVFDTITFGAIGTGANGSTSVAPSYPTGISAGHYLTLHVSSGGSSNPTPSTPSGWTLLGTGTSTDGTWGVDAGPRRMTVFGKIADGTESGTLSVTITGGDTCRGTICRWTKSGSGTWAVTAQGADDSTSGTGVSMTFGSIEWNTGDAVLVAVSQRVDGATQSSQSLTASGVTFGTRTNRASTAVTTGNDHRHVVDTFAAITSTNKVNAAATWAYTASAAVSAGGVIVRLRAYTAAIENPIYIKTSSNITAGGENTTAQLTAPSGKTTSDFTTGRMWDDENGTDNIDIATDFYTELEWCLEAKTPAVNSEIYQFRVYSGSNALATYTETPELTIGSGGTNHTLDVDDDVVFADSASKEVSLNKADTANLSDLAIKDISIVKEDLLELTEEASKLTSISSADTINIIDDSYRTPDKGASDNISLTDDITSKGVEISKADSISLSESISKQVSTLLADSFSVADNATYEKFVALALSDNVGFDDSIIKSFEKALADTASFVDQPSKAISTVLADNISFADNFSYQKFLALALSDSLSFTDTITAKDLAIALSSAILLTDSITKSVGKSSEDNVGMADSLSRQIFKGIADTITYQDAIISREVQKLIADATLFVDVISKRPEISFNDAISLADAINVQLVTTFGKLMRWNGTAWVPANLFRWNGSSYVAAKLFIYDGSNWREVNTSGV